MRVYAPAAVTVSGLNATGWDADLIPAAPFNFDVIDVTGVGDTLLGIMIL